MEINELNKNANGGTELMGRRLYASVDNELLNKFQIIQSRVRTLDPDKKKIYWVHDLPGDPEVQHLKNGGWKKFEKLVFVSHWQQQMYNLMLGVPYSAGVVIQNAINPLKIKEDRNDKEIRLIYTSTPHRGLELLYPVFDHLSKIYGNIYLDVFSSFELYGWKERDAHYSNLFEKLEAHPNIFYHGACANETVRSYLEVSDIFTYPSIWQETSCLCLIEAMSAGLTCVHSSLAALPETSMGHTMMYNYNENVNQHANVFANSLAYAIETHKQQQGNNKIQKLCADDAYNLDVFSAKWKLLLESI